MSQLPAGQLLDTGIYIRAGRGEDYAWLSEDSHVFQRTILTAVVAAGFYAGSRDCREKQALDDLRRAHYSSGQFPSPPAAAWVEAGILLRRARSTFGEMDFLHHFRDLLIALEAARVGATLATKNARDFARWKSLFVSTKRTLRLFDPAEAV